MEPSKPELLPFIEHLPLGNPCYVPIINITSFNTYKNIETRSHLTTLHLEQLKPRTFIQLPGNLDSMVLTITLCLVPKFFNQKLSSQTYRYRARQPH